MTPFRLVCGLVAVCSLLVSVAGSSAEAQDTRTPAGWIASFTQRWDESTWRPEPRRYMRPLDDEGWKVRMRTMHALVSAGEVAVEPLIAALSADDEPTRLLSAHTLGYLAPDIPSDALLARLNQESSSPVQLYLIDSLGMQGGRDLADVLNPLRDKFKNRDVRKHLGYALERGAEGLPSRIRRTLADWDPDIIDTAQVGELAPDFELADVTGERVRLSDFRGKKSVILVFIYGDT